MSAFAPPGTRPAAAHGAEPAAAPARVRVGVLGATGYSGQELIRLALDHPGLEIAALASREHAGRPAHEALPGIDPRQPLPDLVDSAGLAGRVEAGEVDAVAACLPHGAWAALAGRHPALARAALLVDLSSDHRDGSEGYRYGLPEAFRASLAGATRIANPGCYPTAAALALLPAAAARRLAGPVMVSALSGVSGAGRAAALRTSFVELEGGASLYRVGEVHAHVAEMERTLAALGGAACPVAFAPQLVPMARGILLTATAPLDRPASPEELHALYRARYQDEPFVRLLEPGAWPDTRAVRGSNRADLAVTTVHGGRTLLAAAAIDNLVKGAAGQAIQNLNLACGWPETTGLPLSGRPW